jgi:hypothetical protein
MSDEKLFRCKANWKCSGYLYLSAENIGVAKATLLEGDYDDDRVDEMEVEDMDLDSLEETDV